MDRVRNYISFAVWFVGLSYIALWPLAVAQPMLSLALHGVGALAALWVTARLLWLVLRRLLRAVQPPARWRLALRQGVNAMRPEPPALPPPRWVPPRREFGLRRAPR
ncbi:MAG: hypothetical protein KIT48_06780 [Pseudolabrys sp.]|nr:hypothetical protein [Pseudolabrys sp.]